MPCLNTPLLCYVMLCSATFCYILSCYYILERTLAMWTPDGRNNHLKGTTLRSPLCPAVCYVPVSIRNISYMEQLIWPKSAVYYVLLYYHNARQWHTLLTLPKWFICRFSLSFVRSFVLSLGFIRSVLHFVFGFLFVYSYVYNFVYSYVYRFVYSTFHSSTCKSASQSISQSSVTYGSH